jgi:hypothetical protein
LLETTPLETCSRGEKDLLKLYTGAEDLLVLGARALIVIGLGSPSISEGQTGGIVLFRDLSVK